MRRRILHAAGALLFATLALVAISATVAQEGTTLTISGRTLQIENFLRQGRQLEVQRHWGEALTHYEDALRAFPDEQNLERRFESARLHYDLGRRYADRSFCRSLAELSPQQALDLYAGVLLKIQTHYVEEPKLGRPGGNGGKDFEVALGETVFLQQNMPGPRLAGHRSVPPRGIQDAGRANRGQPPGRLRRRGMRGRLGPTTARDAPSRGDPGVPLRGGQRLDPYSAYLTPDQLSEVYSQIEGNFVGLGVELKAQGGELVIVRVISGSPAEAGRRPRRRPHRGHRRPLRPRQYTTEQAANLLQGRDGTTVADLVRPRARPNAAAEPSAARVEVPSVDKVQHASTPARASATCG